MALTQFPGLLCFQLVILLAKKKGYTCHLILSLREYEKPICSGINKKKCLLCCVYGSVSRNLKAECSQASGMKRPCFPPLFSASFSVSAELSSPPEDQTSLLCSMSLFLGLIVPGQPGKLIQYSRLRSEFLGDKNSSPWSGPPLSEFPKLQLGGKDRVV